MLFLILYFILMVVLIVAAILLLKKFVFSKVRINKYIPLVISIVFLLLQIFLRSKNIVITTIVTLLAVLFFAWFWDIQQTGGIKKEKKIVIKPKAKPNRVKKK